MGWEDNHWAKGHIPWDAGAPAPALVDLLARDVLPPGRALVPGCGSGWDAFALGKAGYQVTALDLAPTAAARFHEHREAHDLPADQVCIEVLDAFAHVPEHAYDVIWDYTFLCAIDLGQREAWANWVDRALADHGVVATLIFPAIDKGPDYQGPPWPLFPDHVRRLLEPHGFEAFHLEPATRSHPGREGKEHLGLWRRS